jgi:hypothetical protein
VNKAGRREWVGLGVIALPCLLYSMDLTVLYDTLPEQPQPRCSTQRRRPSPRVCKSPR